jgi:hypothetical protein
VTHRCVTSWSPAAARQKPSLSSVSRGAGRETSGSPIGHPWVRRNSRVRMDATDDQEKHQRLARFPRSHSFLPVRRSPAGLGLVHALKFNRNEVRTDNTKPICQHQGEECGTQALRRVRMRFAPNCGPCLIAWQVPISGQCQCRLAAQPHPDPRRLSHNQQWREIGRTSKQKGHGKNGR